MLSLINRLYIRQASCRFNWLHKNNSICEISHNFQDALKERSLLPQNLIRRGFQRSLFNEETIFEEFKHKNHKNYNKKIIRSSNNYDIFPDDERKLKPVNLDFYDPPKELIERSDSDIIQFQQSNLLKILRGNQSLAKPAFTLKECNFPQNIIEVLANEFSINQPMPLQSQSWPLILSGKDLISIGKTGSGKTLGFLLPGIIHVLHQESLIKGDGPIGLVLAPTRELAQQIEGVFKKFSHTTKLKSSCCTGGKDKQFQLRSINAGAHFIIGTPGRIIDLMENHGLNLRRTSYIVLDEADRMLDMGFEPQIRSILSNIREDRQMLMFSATWPDEVEELSEDFFTKTNDLFHIKMGSSKLYANPDIKQIVKVLHETEKFSALLNILHNRDDTSDRALIFTKTKIKSDGITRMLLRNRINADSIHGDKSQRSRENTLRDFRYGKKPILVATSVAERGLDVDNIKLVINYDFPEHLEDYIHRIGRTGRKGLEGVAYSFFTENDSNLAQKLIKTLKMSNQDIPEELTKLLTLRTNFPSKNTKKRRFNLKKYSL